MAYPEDVHLQVLQAYLIKGWSYRKIQREILNLPAPARGGGYVAMAISHYYGAFGETKGLLAKSSAADFEAIVSESLRSLLPRILALDQFEHSVREQIELGDFNIQVTNTEVPALVKQRVGQGVLRQYILASYNQECAVCPIRGNDLLVCSHIIEWRTDKDNRLNPENAICLCVLHDRLFERGYFSLGDQYEVQVNGAADEYIKALLSSISFKAPRRYPPSKHFLAEHRKSLSGPRKTLKSANGG